MSGTSTPGNSPPGDPSMEDILASIRRILSDDEPKTDPTPPAATAPAAEAADDDVLLLDASMLVPQEHAVTDQPSALTPIQEPPRTSLVAPEAAAAAASSVDDLVRTLHTEQSLRVSSTGPTLEDIVRQELRPLVAAWLDIHLPPLVERLVRNEIERVVGRVRT